MTNKYKQLLEDTQVDQRTSLSSILIIDGLNTFLRNFTMVNTLNPDGHHVGGLTGFLKSIGYAIKIINPTKVVIVFDGVGSSNPRRNLYPGYKANRDSNKITNYSLFSNKDEENESINNQMERLINYLYCLPITLIQIDGLEADDIIGYITNRFETLEDTNEITIMSSDRDFLQLVSRKTKVYSPTKKKIYYEKDVKEEYGVSSNNFINYKVLLGDSADNIPGIEKLGPKKVIKLFPELAEDKTVTLNEIIDKAAQSVDKHALYGAVVERKKQLEINLKLMDLKEVYISEANRHIVKDNFNNSYKLDKHLFMQMYVNDKLGESIPNTASWINEVFGYLNLF